MDWWCINGNEWMDECVVDMVVDDDGYDNGL